MSEQRCTTCRYYRTGARTDCLATGMVVGWGGSTAAVGWRWDNWPAFRDGTPQDPPCTTYDHRPEGKEANHAND